MMLCLNANCVIYLVEKNPHWGPKIVARLATAKAAGLHLAAAIAYGCGLFLTNDEQLKACGGITVEVLT